jgi:hypothetical protein
VTALLAVDPGQVSGWAVFDCSKPWQKSLVEWGTATNHVDRAEVIQCAEEVSPDRVFAHERWRGSFSSKNRAGKRVSDGARTAIGLGRQLGRWEEQLDLRKWRQNARYGAFPSEWGKACCLSAFATQDVRRARSLLHARAVFGVELSLHDHDVAAAICIGSYILRLPAARVHLFGKS